ncbi:single-stranded-DNA-specific exonuclease RecJ [Nitratifractor sp.]
MRSLPLLDRPTLFRILHERFDGSFLSLGDLPDPYVFKDMERAVERIARAIEKGERIVLIGDYDVDGVSSTSIMRLFFEEIDAPLEWIIPNRFRDGYGLSPGILDRIGEVDLIVTVDNGISALDAANICKERGIDLIITDHHIVPETAPDAYAIVNQKQEECGFPYAEVCGAQIAWYLCAALRRRLGRSVDMRDYLEIVALAVIADIMPLQHINRAMVQSGLKLLERSERPFIRAYRELSGKESFTAEDIAFGLAPLINSAGRMEDASVASDYLCAGNIYDARSLLETLRSFNERRKSLESENTAEAMGQVGKPLPRVIVVAGSSWHEGVLGIVAARLSRHYQRPTLVLDCKEGICKGSGRSFGECDLFELVDRARDLLEKFGGHKAAVGLSIREENLEEFRRRLESSGECPETEEYLDPEILGELPLELADTETYGMIRQFEPFGHGNPRPKFVSRSVSIDSIRYLGADRNHASFLFRQGRHSVEGIEFRINESYEAGEIVDIVYTIGENSFRGVRKIQLIVDRVMKR